MRLRCQMNGVQVAHNEENIIVVVTAVSQYCCLNVSLINTFREGTCEKRQSLLNENITVHFITCDPLFLLDAE